MLGAVWDGQAAALASIGCWDESMQVSTCQHAPGLVLSPDTGQMHVAEECDDGNTANYDGCSDMCTVGQLVGLPLRLLLVED